MRAAVLALCLLALGHALDPDVGKDMTDICIARGYTSITQYAVTTEDGYILGLVRDIPVRAPLCVLCSGRPGLALCTVCVCACEGTGCGCGDSAAPFRPSLPCAIA